MARDMARENGGRNSSKQRRFLENMESERTSAALYFALADCEKDGHLSSVYQKMAAAEDRHAQTWMKMAFGAEARIPPFRLSLRTRLYIRMARTFGPAFILPALAGREVADSGSYLKQPEAKGMGREERSHIAVAHGDQP